MCLENEEWNQFTLRENELVNQKLRHKLTESKAPHAVRGVH